MRTAIDAFASGQSPIHTWHPQWKIPALCILALAVSLGGRSHRDDLDWSRDLPPALAALAVALGIVALARLPLRAAARAVRPALFILALLILTLPFTRPPTDGAAATVVALGPLRADAGGLLAAILIAVRAVAVLLIALPLLTTAPLGHSLTALSRLRVPAVLVRLLASAHRSLQLLGDEVRRRNVAWTARGFRARCNRHAFRTLGNGAGMLVVTSLGRGRRLHQAMTARGGRPCSFPALRHQRPARRDAIKAALALAVAAALACWGLA